MRTYGYLVSAILSVCFLTSCKDSTPFNTNYTELKRENIKGKVASMSTATFECDSSGKMGNEAECCRIYFEYDEKGSLVKVVSSDKTGKVLGEEHATTHSSGLQETLTTYEQGNKSRVMKMSINDSGHYTSGKMFDGEGKLTMYYDDIKQNEYGQPVFLILYDKNDSLYFKESSTYKGNLMLTTNRVDKDGNEISNTKLTYDDKGNLIEEESHATIAGQSHTTLEKITYNEFDKQGNWTMRTHWDGNGKASRIVKRSFVYR